jgi:hypothetical protein
MFFLIVQTFALKPLVKLSNHGQTPRAPKGGFSFLARSPDFTIEVRNRLMQKFFVISGNTFS